MNNSCIIEKTMRAFVFGLFFSKAIFAADAYLDLKKAVQAGTQIIIIGEKNPTIRLESKIKRQDLNESETRQWVHDITQSPEVKKDVEIYDPSQKMILEKLFTVYRKYGYPESLCQDMQTFYIRFLKSPDEELQTRAFCLMGTKCRKELETIPDELFKDVLCFAKEHPTCGFDDKNDISVYYNIIFKLGCCGRHQESIEWLESIAGKYPDLEISRHIALIRMGEKQYEKELISKYYKTSAGRAKYNLAIALGYASSEETLKVLALELRNDEVWDGEGFNQCVLIALRRSKEWDIGLPKISFFNQEDFDKAEAWCQKKFNIKWDKPKPPVRPAKNRI